MTVKQWRDWFKIILIHVKFQILKKIEESFSFFSSWSFDILLRLPACQNVSQFFIFKMPVRTEKILGTLYRKRIFLEK